MKAYFSVVFLDPGPAATTAMGMPMIRTMIFGGQMP